MISNSVTTALVVRDLVAEEGVVLAVADRHRHNRGLLPPLLPCKGTLRRVPYVVGKPAFQETTTNDRSRCRGPCVFLYFPLCGMTDQEPTAFKTEGKGDSTWHVLLLKIVYRGSPIALN